MPRKQRGSAFPPFAGAPIRLSLHVELFGVQIGIPLGNLRIPGHSHNHRRLPYHRSISQHQQQELGRAVSGLKAHQQRSGHLNSTPLLAESPAGSPEDILRQRLLIAPVTAPCHGHRDSQGESPGDGTLQTSAGSEAGHPSDVLETLRTSAEDVDEPFLLRWLRAKDYDLDEAEFSIRAHAAWRAEHVTPGGVREADIVKELAMQKVFLQNCDLQGRPVLIILAARHDMSARNPAETQQLIIYTLDNTAAQSDLVRNPLGQFLCLFDLSGLSMNNLDIKALRTVFDLLQGHYPERLSQLWFLNAPWIFWGLWRVVSPFIAPNTRAKIAFCSGRKRQEMLEAEIPQDVLPREYGGRAAMVPIEQAVAARKAAAADEAMSEDASSVGALTEDSSELTSSRMASARRITGRWASAFGGAARRSGNSVAGALSRLPVPRLPAFWHRSSDGGSLSPQLSFRERSMSMLRRQSTSLQRRQADLPPLLVHLLLPQRILLSLLWWLRGVLLWVCMHVPSFRSHQPPLKHTKLTAQPWEPVPESAAEFTEHGQQLL